MPTFLTFEHEPADTARVDADFNTKLPLTYVFENSHKKHDKFFLSCRRRNSCSELAELHASGKPYLCSSVGRVNLGNAYAPFCVNLATFMTEFRKLRLRSVGRENKRGKNVIRPFVPNSLMSDVLRFSKSGQELFEFRWTTIWQNKQRTAARVVPVAYKSAVIYASNRLLD